MEISVKYTPGSPSLLDVSGEWGMVQLINDNGRLTGIDKDGNRRTYSPKNFNMVNALQRLAGVKFPDKAQVERFILGAIARHNPIEFLYEFKDEYLILWARVKPIGDLHKLGGSFHRFPDGKTRLTNVQMLMREQDESLTALGTGVTERVLDQLLSDMTLLSSVGVLTKEKVEGYLKGRNYGLSDEM